MIKAALNVKGSINFNCKIKRQQKQMTENVALLYEGLLL